MLADGSTATFGALDTGGWAARMKQSDFEGSLYRGLDRLVRRGGEIICPATRRSTGVAPAAIGSNTCSTRSIPSTVL